MGKRSARAVAFFGALTGWFALVAQLYLMINNRVTPIPETLLRFFDFFTINTNILVALCFSFIAVAPNSKAGQFFSKATTITAITVYIIIVGIVYNIILRSTWDPQGLQKLVDELLHSVTPVLFLIFWLVYVPTGNLKWENAFPWLMYPVLYMTYALIFGAVTKFYPYPFVDVSNLGYGKALTNAGLVLLVVLFLSFAMIGTGKLMKKLGDKKLEAVN